MTDTILYGIPNCDTVKRARAWLQAQGVDHVFHDLRRSGLPPQAASRWLPELGRERLVNRQGTTWRKLDEAQRAQAERDDTVMALLQAQPSLIKRPVVQWPDGALTIGFDETAWRPHLPR